MRIVPQYKKPPTYHKSSDIYAAKKEIEDNLKGYFQKFLTDQISKIFKEHLDAVGNNMIGKSNSVSITEEMLISKKYRKKDLFQYSISQTINNVAQLIESAIAKNL